jgi:hypothetical protein
LENARYDDNPKKVAQIFHAGLEPVVANNVIEPGEGDLNENESRRQSKKSQNQKVNAVAKSVEKDCLMTACEGNQKLKYEMVK